jgi:phosphoglycerate dehydrogenase-like enzyme
VPELTVVAPSFLAELLTKAPPRGVGLQVVAWEEGRLPVEASEVDVFVPWLTDRAATRQVLSRLPPSSWVCSVSSGIDWFIRSVPEDVLVTGGQGVRSEACAEWVVAVALFQLRGLGVFADRQRKHRWEQACFGTLQGATVLLVGYGHIGQAVEERLRGFGCTFLRVAARCRSGVHDLSKLPDLVGRADVIVIAVPLVESTTGLVDESFLGMMRRGAVLVNVARGPVLDTAALIAALRDQRIRAAVDVTDQEPLPPDDPLFEAPGLLITPHVAGVTPGFAGNAHRFVVAQLERRERGLPLTNLVKREVHGAQARAG